MDYLPNTLKYHFRPKKGWINDPNGLVYHKGYYHVFCQHCPDYSVFGKQPVHWAHARTKDFLHWEELPIALFPDRDYDRGGCWSGTAIVKDDVLYLFYASVRDLTGNGQAVSVAYSTDGIRFEKCGENPVIATWPADGGSNFRDPAVCRVGDEFYCVMATGHEETATGRLLLYKSRDLFSWHYCGVMSEWSDCRFTECPSLVPAENGKMLLTASVCPLHADHYFRVMYGDFADGKFMPEIVSEIDKGPDQYAGQVFYDRKGRNLLISWIPGWSYGGYKEWDIGCLSVPREIYYRDGKLLCHPADEVRHRFTTDDPALRRTEKGFVVEREGREPLIYDGEIRDILILRDSYIMEIFVNEGESVFSVLL